MNIYNYYKYSDNISLSGLPKEEEFQFIKDEGFEIVISLSIPTDSITLENEDEILAELEIPYFHIPVDASAPKVSDFEYFMKLMESFSEYKLYIHCTRNCRLSTFIYLYHAIKENELNDKLLHQFCEPMVGWNDFIEEILLKHNIKGKPCT
jgi:protein tyrosine phosphatase (PTP) superfamily phosphohydrolase (DUF442 family)